MVTWGNNTTALFGKSTPAATPTTPAPAAGTGFSFGAAPSTPPSASQKPAVNPPPLGLAPAPAPAGGFSFGAPATASAPAPTTTGGLFGSTPAPAPATGGLFGSTPAAAAPAPTTSLFGAPAPAPSTTNIFGSTPQPAVQPAAPQQQQQPALKNPTQAALHAHQSASLHQETTRLQQAITTLHSQYSPHSSTNPSLPSSQCAFSAILYDPIPPSHQSTSFTLNTNTNSGAPKHLSVPKPPHLTNQIWNESLARNPSPNTLHPISLIGASALHSRIISQQSQSEQFHQHLVQLSDTVDFLTTTANKSRDRIQVLKMQQDELSRRLLEVMRKVEIVRCMNQPIQGAEENSLERLRMISEQVESVARGLVRLEERGREQARCWRRQGVTSSSSSSSSVGIDNGAMMGEEDKLALYHVLNDQRVGMERLSEIVLRDVRDVDILKDELGKVENEGGRRRVVSGAGPAIFGGR